MNIEYITAPLIGGLIGLITNGLAIKMLFRPLHPVKIGKFTLPFTPGLIPREKHRLAGAIGQVVGGTLLDPETFHKALASDTLKQALCDKVDSVIDQMGMEEGTVSDYLEGKGFLELTDRTVDTVGDRLADYVAKYLAEKNVGDEVLDVAIEKVMGNLNPMVAMMAQPAIEKARPDIAEKVNELIVEECPHVVKGYIGKEYDSWMDKPMRDVAIYLWKKKDLIKDKLWQIYLSILDEKAEQIVRKLNVTGIVEEKINEFDAAYLEKLILDISRKELNALVWIGGILGMIIGFVNLLF